MKKNSQIHLFIETDVVNILRKQAEEDKISLSELCRQRLREGSRLMKIELMLENIIKNRKIYKQVPRMSSNIE